MLKISRSAAGLAGLLVLHAMLAAPPGFGRPQTPAVSRPAFRACTPKEAG